MSNPGKPSLFSKLTRTKTPAVPPPTSGAAPPSPGAGAFAGKKDVRKRWMIIGGALVVFVAVSSSLFKSDPIAPVTKKAKEGNYIDINPAGLNQKNWEAQSQADIQALKEQVRVLSAEVARKNSSGGGTAGVGSSSTIALPPGITPPPSDMGGLFSGTTPPPAPPVPPTITITEPPSAKPSKNGNPKITNPRDLPENGEDYGTTSYDNGSPAEPQQFPAPKLNKGASASSALDEAVKSKTTYKKNAYAGFLPAGSFSAIALLNGLDSGTAVSTQSNPQPVLIRVQDNAVLPGYANYSLKSCFVLGSGYGELSSERVYIRLAQLSCVDKSSRLVLTAPLQGYVVDSDGKLGLRGKITDRQGSRLAKALLAGFAQGLSNAMGMAQSTVTSSALGTATSTTGSDALQASGLSGASQAASQLAQFYLKEAQSIFPVITVDAGRTGTMVITQGANLQWGVSDAQFTSELKPEKS